MIFLTGNEEEFFNPIVKRIPVSDPRENVGGESAFSRSQKPSSIYKLGF